MVSIEAVKNGIVAFSEREIIGKMQGGTVQKFLVGSAVALAIRNAEGVIQKYPFLSAMGIVTADGVDVDALKESVLPNIPDSGVVIPVPVLGSITLYQKDIETLYNDITGGAV